MKHLLSRRAFLAGSLAAGATASRAQSRNPAPSSARKHPHIVLLLADDLGIGDLHCYNPGSSIPTPHADRLAAEGMRFTDAHAAGAVCVPSRYGLLTGRHYWRGENRGLNGYSRNVVELDRMTLAELLRTNDYHTNYIGKWHLGLGETEPADFSKPLRPNPTDHGFDYYFGIPASLDFPPYCYVENGRVLKEPTETIEGTPRGTGGFFREGAIAPDFRHEKVLPQLTEVAVHTIFSHAQQRPHQPLFLYFGMTAPHTPWVPTADATGKSGAGTYGDFVHQMDQTLGRVLGALEDAGMAEDTLFIFTSDNGGLQGWLPEGIEHRMNLDYRGQKGDVWEGGHRVPLLVRWPEKVQANSTTNALVSLNDVFRTCAGILDAELPANAAEDSIDMLPVLQGGAGTRGSMVHDSIAGIYALREGDWKYIEGQGGGGLTFNVEPYVPAEGDPPGQLYNLALDPQERNNLYNEHPERVAQMREALQQARAGVP